MITLVMISSYSSPKATEAINDNLVPEGSLRSFLVYGEFTAVRSIYELIYLEKHRLSEM